jgi:ribosomal protein S18 acetylase RimI-like enzyme
MGEARPLADTLSFGFYGAFGLVPEREESPGSVCGRIGAMEEGANDGSNDRSNSEGVALRPFDRADSSVVASWAGSAAEAMLWCSHGAHPVPAEVVARWQDDGNQTFAAYRDDRLVGYGELWPDVELDEVELARLIVDPSCRRQGVGAALVSGLVEQAWSLSNNVFLRVHPDNTSAERLYLQQGFARVEPVLEAEWNSGQPVRYRWMKAVVD